MFDTIENVAVGSFQCSITLALNVLQAFEHHFKGNAGLQTSQGRTDAEMDAVAEGEMPVGRALEIKGFRVRELCLVVVRGAYPCRHHLALAQFVTTESRVLRNDAMHQFDGRTEA